MRLWCHSLSNLHMSQTKISRERDKILRIWKRLSYYFPNFRDNLLRSKLHWHFFCLRTALINYKTFDFELIYLQYATEGQLHSIKLQDIQFKINKLQDNLKFEAIHRVCWSICCIDQQTPATMFCNFCNFSQTFLLQFPHTKAQ